MFSLVLKGLLVALFNPKRYCEHRWRIVVRILGRIIVLE